ncbi:prepilin-type N-terminal cleavage/methylation domain-containing protein [bacterium]|nr:prepilin-type N-terminal cleavage/methylation domain-containing protein [bacterium]
MISINNKNKFGFSLLEVLLVLALFGIISTFSIPAYISFQNRNDLDLSVQKTVSTLRRAQTLAKNQEGDSDWSIRTTGNTLVLYKGNNFAGRTVSFDESFEFPSTIQYSLTQDIIWQKFLGTPTSTATLTLSNGQNEQKVISINEKGAISY